LKKQGVTVDAVTRTVSSVAEVEALKKAAQYYKNLDYVQAINAYESIAKILKIQGMKAMLC